MISISNFYWLKVFLAGLFIGITLYISACDITDPTEGIRAIINTKERTTTISVIFRDSKTGQPVGFEGGPQVEVTITGPDSDKVIDLLSRPATEFKAVKGFLSFAMLDEVVPDQNQQLDFTIVASREGYIRTSLPVTLANPKNTPIEVFMVSTSDLPKGVTGVSNQPIGQAASDGSTTSEITFGTPLDPVTETTGRFAISQNTRITDDAGNPLTGILRSDAYMFNSRDPESLQSFPGGFSAQVEGSPDGNDRVFFTTGGFTSVSIFDQNGRRARNFDPPIQVTMELDAEVRDHQNNPVTAGSEVPIWSYNDETGTWSFEGNAPVVEGSNGNLEVNFDASHLSWWNIDWFSNSCATGVRVNIEGNDSRLRGRLLRADNGTLLGWNASRSLPGIPNFIEFLWAPRDVPGVLELYDMTDQLITTVNLPDLCSSTPVSVALSPGLQVTFRGVGICPGNDDIEIRPNFPAYYRPLTTGSWLSAGSVVNGELSITLPAADVYMFGAYYENEWYQYELDLSSAVAGQVFEEILELPDDVCDDL